MNTVLTPEARAGVWQKLAELAGGICDAETRDQYLATWRARYEAFAPAPLAVDDSPIVPNGKLAGCTPEEWGRLRLTGETWLQRQRAPTDVAGLELMAWGVGRRVAGRMLDEGEARAALEALAKPIAEGWDAAQTEASAKQLQRSFDAGVAKGYDVWPMVLSMRCAEHARSDLGNAERFRDRFGDDFRFTTAKGWLGWDGRRWRVLDQEQDATPAEVQAAVFATVRAIQDEARVVRETGWQLPEDLEYWIKKLDGDKNADWADLGMNRLVAAGAKVAPLDTVIAKWGLGSESAGKLSCIPGLAKRWLTVPIEDFDTDPLALNCTNGTLRFRRGKKGDLASVELCPHAREDLNTKLVPVAFDPEAQAPKYNAFFAWAQPDAGMRRYLHQWAGYSASGDTGEQLLQFWYGLGANGKSTLIDAWSAVLGDYAGTIGIETFLDQGIKKRGDQATPDLARLGGVRLLRASEPERSAKLNESLIKAATGGEPMAVRALHKGFFDLRPLFKLTISGNHRPDVPGTDEGIWRRLKLVPWTQYLEKDDRDPDLPKKLMRESPGILRAIVDGMLDWLDNGLIEPGAVTAATADYRDDSDPLARFLRLCTQPAADGRVQSSKLHAVYAAWAKAAGEFEWKPKGFSQAMKAKGFTSKQTNGMKWLGLVLTKDVTDFIDHEGKVIDVSDVADEVHERAPREGQNPHPFDDDDDDILP